MMKALLCYHLYALYIKIMSNENKTIHEFDFSLGYIFFSDMERQCSKSSELLYKKKGGKYNLTEPSHITNLGGQIMDTMVIYSSLQKRYSYD